MYSSNLPFLSRDRLEIETKLHIIHGWYNIIKFYFTKEEFDRCLDVLGEI